MPKKNEIEEILLSEKPLDELIKEKIVKEMETEILEARTSKNYLVISDYIKLPRHETFSKNAVYEVFSRKTKQESLLNGVQVEGLLGLDVKTMERLINREIESFVTDDYYVKFKDAKIKG